MKNSKKKKVKQELLTYYSNTRELGVKNIFHMKNQYTCSWSTQFFKKNIGASLFCPL